VSTKLAEVKRIVEDYVDTDSIAKKLLDIGFALPAKKKIIPAGADFFALMHDSNRMKKLSDGWTRDEFLSLLHRKKFDWAPENLEKHIPWQPAEDHAASLSDKIFTCRQASVFEWETIKDRTKYNPAIIEAAKALNLKTDDWYWTREDLKAAGLSGSAWVVALKGGDTFAYGKGSDNYVRPVRLSQ
jgi:hypothetical protein